PPPDPAGVQAHPADRRAQGSPGGPEQPLEIHLAGDDPGSRRDESAGQGSVAGTDLQDDLSRGGLDGSSNPASSRPVVKEILPPSFPMGMPS
ncbi:MAG: hypothetical protein R3338_11390, partial [Thermoanaerobaculia bacterium]|nr:hypothetical protein [Thermoanaerobaculia bacterium]